MLQEVGLRGYTQARNSQRECDWPITWFRHHLSSFWVDNLNRLCPLRIVCLSLRSLLNTRLAETERGIQ